MANQYTLNYGFQRFRLLKEELAYFWCIYTSTCDKTVSVNIDIVNVIGFSVFILPFKSRGEKRKRKWLKKTLTTEEWILCSNLIFRKFLIRKCISLVSNFYLLFPLYSFSHIRLPVYSKHLIKKLLKLIASAVNIFWKMNVTFAMFFDWLSF